MLVSGWVGTVVPNLFPSWRACTAFHKADAAFKLYRLIEDTEDKATRIIQRVILRQSPLTLALHGLDDIGCKWN